MANVQITVCDVCTDTEGKGKASYKCLLCLRDTCEKHRGTGFDVSTKITEKHVQAFYGTKYNQNLVCKACQTLLDGPLNDAKNALDVVLSKAYTEILDRLKAAIAVHKLGGKEEDITKALIGEVKQ